MYKTKSIAEAKKKEIMDKHLSFLVGQTQRYSSMLAKRLQAGSLPFYRLLSYLLNAILLAKISPLDAKLQIFQDNHQKRLLPALLC